jgi:ribosomal protein S18 acetylase RimI-like enzyme
VTVGPTIRIAPHAFVRWLERHQARAYAIGDRRFIELGDAFLLHDGRTAEPAFNRLGGLDWPEPAPAFDRRLGEVLALFAEFDRRPYAWIVEGVHAPADVSARFEANGFEPGSGGYLMLLADGVPLEAGGGDPPPGVTLERLAAADGGRDDAFDDVLDEALAGSLSDAGAIMRAAFGVPADGVPALEDDLADTLRRGGSSVVLARLDGLPVAAGRRTAFDGATYLSAIGVKPGFERRGLGGAITTALVSDARLEGQDRIYLAVDATNVRAWGLYERLGFEAIGGRAVDYILG